MNWLKTVAQTLGSRLIAVVVSVVVAKAAQKGLTLDPAEVGGLVLGAYATVHRGVSSRINPGDAAKGRLADAEKDASDTGTTVKVRPSV